MRSVILILAVACGTISLSAQARGAEEAGIRAQAVAFESALNKRDAAALVALFAPEGEQINPDGSRVASRVDIRRAHETVMRKWPPAMKATVAVTGVTFIGPASALAQTVTRFSEGTAREIRSTWVMVRKDGKWLISTERIYPAQPKK
jgi:uncharacterized protein (TIGR02246 family)